MRLNVTVVVVAVVNGRAEQRSLQSLNKKRARPRLQLVTRRAHFWSGRGQRGRGGEKQIELGWMGEGRGEREESSATHLNKLENQVRHDTVEGVLQLDAS